MPSRQKYLLHHEALGDRFRNLFKARLQEEQAELFAQVPAEVWQRHWNVGCQKAGSGENALRYLARYVFKTATSNRPLTLRPDGKVIWPYRDSQTRRDTAIPLEPQEWLRRFLQHILPPHFARVRTFGWLHPAAKVRGNRVRALLGKPALLSNAEQQTWNPLPDPQAAVNTEAPPPAQPSTRNAQLPLCPHCRKAMRRVGSWHAGQPMPLPNRPP